MSYATVLAAATRDDTATLVGSGTAMQPWLTDSYSFTGSGVLTYPDQLTLNVGNDFTWACWFRPTALADRQILIETGAGHGWSVYLATDTIYFVWAIGNAVQSCSHSITGRAGQDIHVAVCVDGQAMTLYVDGSQADTATHGTTYTGTQGANDGHLGGSRSIYYDHAATKWTLSGDSQDFTGLMDQALLYDGALNAADVSDLAEGAPAVNNLRRRARRRPHSWKPEAIA